MKARVIFIVFIFEHVLTCMRTGSSSGGSVATTTTSTTTTTTTTTTACATIANEVLMFQQNNNQFQPEVWGAVASTTCQTCANSAENYWPVASSATPTAAAQQAAGSLNSVNCPNFCGCTSASVCYTWSTTSVTITVTFWPYGSSMYGVLTATLDTQGLTPVSGGTTITAGSQLTVVNNIVVYQPVTSGLYPAFTSVGCSGCSGNPTSC